MSELPGIMDQMALKVRIALETADLATFADVLDPNVRWGAPGDPSPPCQSREQVLTWYQQGKESGATARVNEIFVLGDHVIVGLLVSHTPFARERGGEAARWQVLTVRDGRVVDIVAFDQRAEAVACAAASAS